MINEICPANGEMRRALYAEGHNTQRRRGGCLAAWGMEGSRPVCVKRISRGLHGRSIGRRRGNGATSGWPRGSYRPCLRAGHYLSVVEMETG